MLLFRSFSFILIESERIEILVDLFGDENRHNLFHSYCIALKVKTCKRMF